MNHTLTRRQFLRQGSVLATGAATLGAAAFGRAADPPSEKVVVGVIGCHGRGMAHIAGYLSVPHAEIGYICDVDKRAMAKGIAAVERKQSRKPQGIKDLRRLLEQPDLDAVSIATPDHWHAPAAILACAAGKHVYVEKPASHNLHESRLLVAAARKHKRLVQMGDQRRSWPWVCEAMAALRGGELGAVRFARGWYTNHRPSIGHGQVVPVPEWLDWELWQGPAPDEPFRDNLPHYNWHWFWNWGTGELGNNGVHALDLARWGLAVDHPRRVTCSGNRYHFRDDWQTPDTCIATFDFGDRLIAWEGQSCDPRGFEGSSFGVNFYGEKGALTIAGSDAKFFDLKEKLIREIKGGYDDILHFANFIAAVREGQSLRAEIADAELSTRLCHLGNIAWRTGHTLDCDPNTGEIKGDRAARALERRSYRRGWEPRV